MDLPKKRSKVAIKHIIGRKDSLGNQGFITEIKMLTRCKHKNIISLVGFCSEGPHNQFLVYEYASKGSLCDFLEKGKMANITWEKRVKICLDVAEGLNYLHTNKEGNQRIIHCDIKSDNILLDEDLNAKIGDFGLSKFLPTTQQIIRTSTIVGTKVYMDPEYESTGKLKKESDVYSFGVVLFEILCGKVAYDKSYVNENKRGLGAIARQRFESRTITMMIDRNLKKDINEMFSTRNSSLDVFSEIACNCLSEKQDNRPTMECVINKLKEALFLHEFNKNTLKFSHDIIQKVTHNFAQEVGRHEKYGMLYKGDLEVEHVHGRTPIIAKVLVDRLHVDDEFEWELQTLYDFNHKNIISLEGFCYDRDNTKHKRIIVYRDATNGTLKGHLRNSNLTWMNRLKICIGVARGLDFLHGRKEMVIHRDLNSSSILVTDDWKAKIANFGRCFIRSKEDVIWFEIDDSTDYIDPVFHEEGNLTSESDIYSFGLVLFEILCGELVVDHNDKQFLPKLVKDRYGKDEIDGMVFEGIKKQIAADSLTTFQKIAYRCLHDRREDRPTASEVLLELEKALEFQEDIDIWAPKLPEDYIEILEKSKNPVDYSNPKNKDIYEKLCRGILFKDGNMCFSLGINSERKEMISARTFLHKKCTQYRWLSVPESRFSKVAEVFDSSHMNIQVKMKTHFLSKDVNYMVFLIFKFCNRSTSQAKRMYVNLRYKIGNKNLHAYFATWREDEWLSIKLSSSFNSTKNTGFKVLLEGFSRCYCPSHAIYIKGIEFQVNNNASFTAKREISNNSINAEEVGNSLLSRFWPSTPTVKRMLSAKEVLHESSSVNLRPPNKSRSREMLVLSPLQVFRIKCKIGSKTLVKETKYACFLVFSLSEECCGLHFPVKVRDILQWKNKEAAIIYFSLPNSLNQEQVVGQVPTKRKDGLMEVNVWKFNSSHNLRKDYIPMNLKLSTYEGIMQGLIIHWLEFRRI